MANNSVLDENVHIVSKLHKLDREGVCESMDS